jgi:hypothetical protein
MKRTYPILRASALLVSAALCCLVSCSAPKAEERHITDRDFIMVEEIPSPDHRFVILVYRYDAGAFGEGRYRWAVNSYVILGSQSCRI